MPVPKTPQAFPGYRSKGAPHLSLPPNLMCFHLTLLIHCTHAHIWRHMLKFMNKHKWTSDLYRHAGQTDTQTHTWCAASSSSSSSSILEELQCAQISAQGKTHHETGFLQLTDETHTYLNSRPVCRMTQGEKKAAGLFNTCQPKSLTKNLYRL